MRQQTIITFGLLFIAIVTNVYAAMQTGNAGISQDSIINILVWCIVTMGAALVSLIVYFMQGIRKDIVETKTLVQMINGRLIAVETAAHMIDHHRSIS
jgi:hypothetical protein